MLRRAIALVSHGREIGRAPLVVNLVMHRNSGSRNLGNKKRAEAQPRLHRLGSPARDVSSVHEEATHPGHLPSPRRAGPLATGCRTPARTTKRTVVPDAVPVNVHGRSFFQICAFGVKFWFCGFGHGCGSFRKTARSRDI